VRDFTVHWQPYSQEYLGSVTETWLRDYDSITVGRADYFLKDVILNTFVDNQTSMVVILASSWGGSRGGSVEPPKLNIKMYNKRMVKKKSEPTQLIK